MAIGSIYGVEADKAGISKYFILLRKRNFRVWGNKKSKEKVYTYK